MTMSTHAASGSSPFASGCAGGGGAGVDSGMIRVMGRLLFVAAKRPWGGNARTAAVSSRRKLRADLAIDHRPGNGFVVIDNILVNAAETTGRGQRDQVGECARHDFSELPAPPASAGGIHR